RRGNSETKKPGGVSGLPIENRKSKIDNPLSLLLLGVFLAFGRLFFRLVFLVGGADEDETAVGAGDGALDEDQVIVGVGLDDREGGGGDGGVAILSSGGVALFGPAEAAVGGVRADATARAMHFLGAMGGRQALVIVAFHLSGKAAAFAGADHIHRLDVLEHVA